MGTELCSLQDSQLGTKNKLTPAMCEGRKKKKKQKYCMMAAHVNVLARL